jgi:hypothetical protein
VPGRIDGRKRPVSDLLFMSHATGETPKGHELTVDKDVLEAEKYRHGEKTSIGISGRRLSCDQPGELPAGFVWEARDGWEL